MPLTVAIGTKVVRGVEVRADPAREPCFDIVHLHEDVPDSGGMDREHRCQRLHREYNQEIQTIELAALSLVDFPDASWDLRMELARQCWDESRHAALMQRRLEANGGRKGEFAIANLDWSVVAMLDSMVARLAIQNRTFEAGSLDIEQISNPMFRAAGDSETADLKDAIEADEIHHVRFANEWLNRLTDAEPRLVLKIGAAIAWLKQVVAATGGSGLHEIPTDPASRRLAGFTEGEISEVARIERIVNEQMTKR